MRDYLCYIVGRARVTIEYIPSSPASWETSYDEAPDILKELFPLEPNMKLWVVHMAKRRSHITQLR